MCDLHGGAIFGPQEHNLNKLSRVSLDDARNIIIKSPDLVVSEKKIFICFASISLCKL